MSQAGSTWANYSVEISPCALDQALVPAHAAGQRAIHDGSFPTLISGDGFHLDAAGYRIVAAAFARALQARS